MLYAPNSLEKRVIDNSNSVHSFLQNLNNKQKEVVISGKNYFQSFMSLAGNAEFGDSAFSDTGDFSDFGYDDGSGNGSGDTDGDGFSDGGGGTYEP